MTSTPLLHASRSTRSEIEYREEKASDLEYDAAALLNAMGVLTPQTRMDVLILVAELNSRADRIRRGMPEGD